MIYDISQEVYSSTHYPGHPVPTRQLLKDMHANDRYTLSTLSMCVHNGTHVDAPNHFIQDGKSIDQMPLEAFVGKACVIEHQGPISAQDASDILQKANGIRRLLLKGDVVVTLEAAEVFASSNLLLLANEPQAIGPMEAPLAVHVALLAKEIVLMEGIRLNEVEEGIYFLSAAPLKLKDTEGSPCRAYLLTMDEFIK